MNNLVATKCLMCATLFSVVANANVDSAYTEQRYAEAKEYRAACWDELDPMLCLTERGFTCISKESDGRDAWYCSLQRKFGRFEAIIFYGDSNAFDRLRWRTDGE